MKTNTTVVVARVRSKSNPRRVYKITGTRRAPICPCLAFRYAHGTPGSRTKRCRHLDEAGL